MSWLELDSEYGEKPLEDFKQGRVMSQLVFPKDSLGIVGRPPAGGLGQRPSLGKRCKVRSVGEPQGEQAKRHVWGLGCTVLPSAAGAQAMQAVP